MAKEKRINAPAEQLALYLALLASVEGVEDKSNFGSAYTAMNGNMYSMISKYGLVGIRLDKADREAFLEQYDTEMFRADPAWPPNRELVAVPDELLHDTAALTPWMQKSFDYARTLKPKPTKKPAKKG